LVQGKPPGSGSGPSRRHSGSPDPEQLAEVADLHRFQLTNYLLPQPDGNEGVVQRVVSFVEELEWRIFSRKVTTFSVTIELDDEWEDTTGSDSREF